MKDKEQEEQYRAAFEAEKDFVRKNIHDRRTADLCRKVMTDSDLQLRFLSELFAFHTSAIALMTTAEKVGQETKEVIQSAIIKQDQAVFAVADIVVAMRVRKDAMKTLAATINEGGDANKN